MKTNQLFILTGLAAIASTSCSQKENTSGQPAKPMNILYIMTDDHSFQTISAYDKRYIQTPNIDRIANEGVRFTNSFVANSISGPSRACMLTGKHSHKNGFIDNAHTFDGSQQTFPKLLRKAGYQTAMIGKWHLTSDPTGFDYWNILVGQGDYYNPIFIDNGEKRQIEGYATNITTDLALDWLDNKRDKSKPFCLLLHHKAPHRTWMPDTCDLRLYDDVTFPLPENFYDDYAGRIAASEQEMSIIKDMDTIVSAFYHSLSLLEHDSGNLDMVLMSSGWLKPLNTLTCENLVTPVNSTNFKSLSAALKTQAAIWIYYRCFLAG